MSIQRHCFILLSAILLIPGMTLATGSSYNYISPADLESRIKTNQPTNLIDIQVEDEFSQHHIKGAIPTYAYPVKNDADRSKLDTVIEQVNANSDPVVIVCPRGGGGAKRTYDYLLEQSIPAERLLILEKGQSGWVNRSLLESK
ncbi:MAG: hypothetical protein C0623_02735 [Desulfuromonas sp.]|nr:MAG: hypothetical protein C0623_02735 [Desulfuromonas sp.]